MELRVVRQSLAPARGRRSLASWLDDLPAQLPNLQEALQLKRDFRREQIAHLDENPSTAIAESHATADETTRALREVRTLVTAGARRALADIELALARIQSGSYGRCRACGRDIPLALLKAIPETTLCLPCRDYPIRPSRIDTVNGTACVLDAVPPPVVGSALARHPAVGPTALS